MPNANESPEHTNDDGRRGSTKSYEGICITDELDRAVQRAVRITPRRHETLGELVRDIAAQRGAQQCIEAGLIDELGVELVPVLLGEGIRFFDHLGLGQVKLERTRVVEAPGVTHLRFRVVR